MCTTTSPTDQQSPPQASEATAATSKWTRKDYDELYDRGDCPKPSPSAPRKWQYLPATRTGRLHDLLLRLLWLPLGCVLFVVVLPCNVLCLAWVLAFRGGIRANALRTTQPRSSRLLRWILGLIDIFNVTEIPRAWDADRASAAFEAFRVRNGFGAGDVRFEVRDVPDTVATREVVHKYHRAEVHPARLHRVWVLRAPSRTYVCTATNFAEFDGTSCFNLVRGFVETYYDGTPPLVRPRAGHPELDLRLTDDPRVSDRLSWRRALRVCLVESYRFAARYGRYILSREVFDMLGCASPEVCAAAEWIEPAENQRMAARLERDGTKMFQHLMVSSVGALARCAPRVDRPVLLTQVSCQSRYYEPRAEERNLCGNWLIGVGARPGLADLGDPGWCRRYYRRLRGDLDSFDGGVADNFIAQTVLGFSSTALWSNPRIVYWFNNYGLRSMHEDAGGVKYFWGPNYGVATYCLVNVLTVDGRTCITLLSSVLPQGELERCAALMKQLMVEEIGDAPIGASGAANNGAAEKDKNA